MAKEKKEKTPGYEEFHDALQSGAVGECLYIPRRGDVPDAAGGGGAASTACAGGL